MSGMQTLRLLRSEDGAATVEFMIMFPLVLFVFFTSFEAGYAMVRAAFLTRALDQGLHEVQLGNITSTDALRLALCQKLAVAACDSDVTVELTVLNTDRSNPPVLGSACQTQDVTIRTGTRATWIGDGGSSTGVCPLHFGYNYRFRVSSGFDQYFSADRAAFLQEEVGQERASRERERRRVRR